MRITKSILQLNDIPRRSRDSVWVPVIFTVLISACLALGAIVWWQLLSELP